MKYGYDIPALIRECEETPDSRGTIVLRDMRAGALVRRAVRQFWRDAEVVSECEVRWTESKGLLESSFSARLTGTGSEMLTALIALQELIGELG